MCIQNIYAYNCGHSYEFLVLHPGATEPCEVVSEIAVPVGRNCGCEKPGYCAECHGHALVGRSVNERCSSRDCVEREYEQECEESCCLAGPATQQPNSGQQDSPAVRAPSLVDLEARDRQQHNKETVFKYRATNQSPADFKPISPAELQTLGRSLENSIQDHFDKLEEIEDDMICSCPPCSEYSNWRRASSNAMHEEMMNWQQQQFMADNLSLNDEENLEKILRRFELAFDIRDAGIATRDAELEELGKWIEDVTNEEARRVLDKGRERWERKCAEGGLRTARPSDSRERRHKRGDTTTADHRGVTDEQERVVASSSHTSPPLSRTLYNELLDADDEVEQLELDLLEIEQRLEDADLRREAKYNMIRSRQEREAAQVDHVKRGNSEAGKKNKGKERKKE
jgi:hypothetical protein